MQSLNGMQKQRQLKFLINQRTDFMHKFLKFLFSQATIVSILLLLQLSAIAASLFRISEYFTYFNIFLQLVSAFTVVVIVNRHSNPSYKLAWVIPILMFPLFGGLFYLFITGQMHTKNYFKKLSSLEKEINGQYSQNADIVKELTLKYPHRLQIFQDYLLR